MPSMKLIKRRISSIKSTHHIMKAMDLVASSKLQRAKQKLDAIRPMFGSMEQIMKAIKSSDQAETSVYFEKRTAKSVAYVVITSDRGLCGGYNQNISKLALSLLNSNADKQEYIITVGSKGFDFLRRRGKTINQRTQGASDTASFYDAEFIGSLIISQYLKGEIDEAYVVYTQFNTILSHTPAYAKLLPLEPESHSVGQAHMTYDPDIKGFMEYAVPMYINNFIYGAMVESVVCEQAARMTSMESAANNAADIIDDLTLEYNRKRQGLITQEITEIVSGANALQ